MGYSIHTSFIVEGALLVIWYLYQALLYSVRGLHSLLVIWLSNYMVCGALVTAYDASESNISDNFVYMDQLPNIRKLVFF